MYKRNIKYLIFSLLPILISAVFLSLNFNGLPYQVGLFFSRPWGEAQLSAPKFLFLIPVSAVIFLIIDAGTAFYLEKKGKRELADVSRVVAVLQAVFLSFCLISIVYNSSPHDFFRNLEILNLVGPWLISFLAVYFVTPSVIRFANSRNLIDDPATHHHPAQLLSKPTPRGGALAFFIGFVLVSLLFLPFTKPLMGIFLGTLLLVIVGLIDDRAKYTSPKMRLVLQFLAAFFVVGAGVGISYIENPLGSTILLDRVVIPFDFIGHHSIVLFADIFAVLWIVFLANAVSWSNGIDGQFSGFAGIACLVIALASAKTAVSDNDPTQMGVAVLAAIASGSAFGLAPATWHPQKILWGFGATAVGLVIGALSILSLSKVYIVSMVLLVPLIDSLVTGLRRILQKKSPFWGDRGHLHHRMLDLGWSKPQIALFYWLVTAIFGMITVLSNESDIDLDVVRFGVGTVFLIVTVNLGVEWRKTRTK